MIVAANRYPLFQRFGLTTTKHISVGDVPIPYHIYSGVALLIGGTADLACVRRLLAGEHVHPIVTQRNRALVCIWVIDGKEASLGPHRELQVSILVSHEKLPEVIDDPLTILYEILAQPQARLLCHGLWNDTETSVAYNRELLALPAQPTVCRIEYEGEHREQSFTFDDVNGGRILAGHVRVMRYTIPATVFALLRVMGIRRFYQLGSATQLEAQVVNPVGLLPFNADAQAYINADRVVLQLFNRSTDSLTLDDSQYPGLDFEGSFIERMQGFRFVYLNIHDAGDTQITAAQQEIGAGDETLTPEKV
jgi:hypothetical protein